MAVAAADRPRFEIARAVWKALFLREMVARLSQDRYGWLWMIVEPLAHAAILVWIRVVLRQRVFGGMDPILFIVLGVLGFFVARNIINRSFDAVSQNLGLYAFRQIKPVDTILSRAVVEGFLSITLLFVVLVGVGLIGVPVLPAHPLDALEALGILWLLGLGLGLIVSVLGELLPEAARVLRVMMTPLYFLSAVMFQSISFPHWLREWMMYNPFLHCIEALRVAFTPTYRVPNDVNLAFPAACALVFIFLGLLLHLRYRQRLIAR